MHFKRCLFLTLILFLTIISISFVGASDNLAYNHNAGGLDALSVSDVDSNDGNLNAFDLNSVDQTEDSSLVMVSEDDADEIGSDDCLAYNETQLLRANNDVEKENVDKLGTGKELDVVGASDNEEKLGAHWEEISHKDSDGFLHFDEDGTVQDVMDAMADIGYNGVICLEGHTFTGDGELGVGVTLNRIWVLGGSGWADYSKNATFTGRMNFHGCVVNDCRFSCINAKVHLAHCRLEYNQTTQEFSGYMKDTIFEYCTSAHQFIFFVGNIGNATPGNKTNTTPLQPDWNGQAYNVTNCKFWDCHQIFGTGVDEFKDGHGQFVAGLGTNIVGCEFINCSSDQHSSAICISDESEWENMGYVPSSVRDCKFINLSAKWFAVYIHGRYSASPYSGMYGYHHRTIHYFCKNSNILKVINEIYIID